MITKKDLEVHDVDDIFEALDIERDEQFSTKALLTDEINKIIKGRRLTQKDAAGLLGIDQPQVSRLKNYELYNFSVERLIGFLVSLDRDVEIKIKKKPRSRPAMMRVSA